MKRNRYCRKNLKKLEIKKQHQAEKYPEKDEGEIKTLDELKKEANIYIETFEELVAQSRELQVRYDKKYFRPELLESVVNLTSTKEVLLDLYDSSEDTKNQKQALEMLNETLKIRNYLLVEFMRQAKSKKDSEE